MEIMTNAERKDDKVVKYGVYTLGEMVRSIVNVADKLERLRGHLHFRLQVRFSALITARMSRVIR